MPPLFKQLTPEYLAERRREFAEEFPGSRFGCPPDMKVSLLNALQIALQSGPEEVIQNLLTDNPYLIQYAVKHSGHHGVWAFPKQMIKPRAADGTQGLIPDFLIATRSSLGYFWYIVELKRFDVQFANEKGSGFSSEGNKAIVQCNTYLAHFQDYVDSVRSNIRVAELIQPEGAILLIGDSKKETPSQRRCRAEFVRNHPKIDVVSYRRILNGLESDAGLRP
jgi:hypothetical protein